MRLWNSTKRGDIDANHPKYNIINTTNTEGYHSYERRFSPDNGFAIEAVWMIHLTTPLEAEAGWIDRQAGLQYDLF